MLVLLSLLAMDVKFMRSVAKKRGGAIFAGGC